MNAIAHTQVGAKRPAAPFGEGSIGGRGGRGGKGGRTNQGGRGAYSSGGRGSPGAGPSNPLLIFGTTMAELKAGRNEPCPLHSGPTYTGQPHTKGACGKYALATAAFFNA